MDLDKMKSTWKAMDEQERGNMPLDKKQLAEIVESKYARRMLKLAFFDVVLVGLCVFGILFFVVFFRFFEQTLNQILAALAICLLIAIPALRISSLYKLYETRKLTQSFQDTIEQFKLQAKQFAKIQLITSMLCVLLLGVLVVLVPIVYTERPTRLEMIVAFFILAIIFFGLTSVIRKFYRKQMAHINQLLKALE